MKFSGQGSQYYQMGGGLYKEDREFREWMHELDATTHLIGGRSILKHLYDEKRKRARSHFSLFGVNTIW
ncbi:MAG: hypothetical protein SVM80_08020 [Halobacteriota archaeon]|nr:hypothetical protein [Halobacteriota archaeon]